MAMSVGMPAGLLPKELPEAPAADRKDADGDTAAPCPDRVRDKEKEACFY